MFDSVYMQFNVSCIHANKSAYREAFHRRCVEEYPVR